EEKLNDNGRLAITIQTIGFHKLEWHLHILFSFFFYLRKEQNDNYIVHVCQLPT
ncbi:unnamed protein product, partial [Prunus brigantina]